jgi:hypothetical protein
MSAARKALERILDAVRAYLPPDGIDAKEALSRIIAEVDPWPLEEAELAADMTMRDCFAARAMQSLVGDIAFMREVQRKGMKLDDTIALAAYMQADAMLKARQQ